jgi:hypothetical protein
MVGRTRSCPVRAAGGTGKAVEDLIKRSNRAIAKLEATGRPESRVRLERTQTAVVSATPSGGVPGTTGQDAEVEVLVCQGCNRRFERMRVRGRKPTLLSNMPCGSESVTGFHLGYLWSTLRVFRVASFQASTCLLGPRWTKEIIEPVHQPV